MASVTANSRMASRSAGTVRCRSRGSGARSTPAPVRRRTRSGSASAARSCWRLRRLFNIYAYGAATAIAVIGLYVAYVIPVYLRLRDPDFQVGPWNLGKWSKPVGWTAVVWVIAICIMFILPTAYPLKALTFNYTIVAVVIVLGGASLWWVLSARKWFTGPRANIDDAVPAIPGQAVVTEVTVVEIDE